MSISIGDRIICKYNLRGMCRFGQRCRNVHEDPEVLVERMIRDSVSFSDISDESHDDEKIAKPVSPKRRTHHSGRNSRKDHICQPSTSQAAAASIVTVSQAKPLKTEAEEKTCGICFDVVLQKVNRMEQTFGILPNCNHVFCFTCIRKWRQSKEFEFEVSKSCPECRIASDFVYPAKYWIDNKEDKEKFIKGHKDRMKKVNCKYFRQGSGNCPFGNTCLYLHALPNGELRDVGPPKPRRRPPTLSGEDLVHQILFWMNDDEYDFDDSDDSDEDDDLDFEVDLQDPCIASLRYIQNNEIPGYIQLETLYYDGDSLEATSPPVFFD